MTDTPVRCQRMALIQLFGFKIFICRRSQGKINFTFEMSARGLNCGTSAKKVFSRVINAQLSEKWGNLVVKRTHKSDDC